MRRLPRVIMVVRQLTLQLMMVETTRFWVTQTPKFLKVEASLSKAAAKKQALRVWKILQLAVDAAQLGVDDAQLAVTQAQGMVTSASDDVADREGILAGAQAELAAMVEAEDAAAYAAKQLEITGYETDLADAEITKTNAETALSGYQEDLTAANAALTSAQDALNAAGGGEDHAHPEDIGIGMVAGWAFGDLAAWGAANASELEAPNETFPIEGGSVDVTALEYEFGLAVLSAIGHGQPVGEMPVNGATAISLFDDASGLFVELENSGGFTVGGTEEEPIVEGAITNITVTDGSVDGPGETVYLTGTELSLTFEDDIAPLFHSEDGGAPVVGDDASFYRTTYYDLDYNWLGDSYVDEFGSGFNHNYEAVIDGELRSVSHSYGESEEEGVHEDYTVYSLEGQMLSGYSIDGPTTITYGADWNEISIDIDKTGFEPCSPYLLMMTQIVF